jgi:hypothetical protein
MDDGAEAPARVLFWGISAGVAVGMAQQSRKSRDCNGLQGTAARLALLTRRPWRTCYLRARREAGLRGLYPDRPAIWPRLTIIGRWPVR